MPVPDWVAGQTLLSSDVNAWMRPLAGYKVSDSSVTSAPVLAADPDLIVTFPTNGTWVIEMYVRYNGPASNGLAYGFAGTNLSGNFTTLMNPLGGGGPDFRYVPWSNLTMVANTTGTGNTTAMRIAGLVTASAGSFGFQWGQNASSATATTVRTGSYLMAWRAN